MKTQTASALASAFIAIVMILNSPIPTLTGFALGAILLVGYVCVRMSAISQQRASNEFVRIHKIKTDN